MALIVSHILEDWKRKLSSRRSCGGTEDTTSDWNEFVKCVRDIWTPTEQSFDQELALCPKWLANGQSFANMSISCEWVGCSGSCGKAHPSITLFFDEERNDTIAVLTHALKPFSDCLDSLERCGIAKKKTLLYYRLDGFVRENITRLRHQPYFGEHLVQPALGALVASDAAQQRELEESRSHTQGSNGTAFYMLEEVLEICRLHRMGEDLDLMTIYCMRRTSKAFGRIAARMAKQRIDDAIIAISPLADGCCISGYSTFRRGATGSSVIQSVYGRLVEYCRKDDIICRKTNEAKKRYKPDQDGNPSFFWNCQELSFANLERSWGDITVHEYFGQKLDIKWRRGPADQIQSEQDVSLASVRLFALPPKGSKTCRMPSVGVKLDIHESKAEQLDDVTVVYKGEASVTSVELDFLCLVRAYARCLLPFLHSQRSQIEETRPLLVHEIEYMEEVSRTASLSL